MTMMTVTNMCFICLNAVSNKQGNEILFRGKNSWSCVKTLISYILHNYTRNNNDSSCRDLLRENLVSSFRKERLPVCPECLSNAEHLLKLHLELEKVQMQILDALRNLQIYLKRKKSVMMTVDSDGNGNGNHDGDLSLASFQEVLEKEFMCLDITDKAQVRLERLNIAGYRNAPSLPRNPDDCMEVVNKTSHKRNVVKEEVVTSDLEWNHDLDIDDNYDEDYTPDFQVDVALEADDNDIDNENEELDMKPPKVKRKRDSSKNQQKSKNNVSSLRECDICLEDIPSNDMEIHLKTHPEFEKYYTCHICPPRCPKRIYGTYKGLVWHYLRTNHNHNVLLPCKLCPDQFLLYTREVLCKHLYEIHHPNHRKLQCKNEDCSEEFYDPQSRGSHQCHKVSVLSSHSGNASMACTICHRAFKTKRYLSRHIRQNHPENEGLLQCKSCGKSFRREGNLRIHLMNCHGMEVQKQEESNTGTGWNHSDQSVGDDYASNIEEDRPNEVAVDNNLQIEGANVRTMKTENPRKMGSALWNCDICLEDITSNEMETHLKTHPEFEKFYTCDICPGKYRKRVFGTYKGLVWHYFRKGHHVQLPCKLCSDQSVLFTRGHLCKHLYEIHHPNHKKLSCINENCFQEFFEPQSLRSHQWLWHSGPEKWKCDLCNEVFKTKPYLKKHIRRLHPQQGDIFQCASCPKSFRNTMDLRTHELNLHERELQKCPHCFHMVPQNLFKAHLRTHGERTLQCQFCTMKFTTVQRLRTHQETHATGKNFMCSKCPYMSKSKTGLYNHMKCHGENKYKCQYCTKTFPIKKYRDNHQRIHTGEKPFRCEVCEKTFFNSSSRLRHRRKKHGIPSFKEKATGV